MALLTLVLKNKIQHAVLKNIISKQDMEVCFTDKKWYYSNGCRIYAHFFVYYSTYRTAECLTRDFEGNWRSPDSYLHYSKYGLIFQSWRTGSIFPRNCTWKTENPISWVAESSLSHNYHLFVVIIACPQTIAKKRQNFKTTGFLRLVENECNYKSEEENSRQFLFKLF